MNRFKRTLLIALLFSTPSVYAINCNFLLLENKTYPEGVEIKSPMKAEPLFTRLLTNTQYFLNLIKKPERNIEARTPDFLSDFDYLTEKRYDNRLGKMNTFFDPEFDTRFYHSVTAKALPNGTIPVVDPEAKGLFIYIHGSGTNKSSGANFSYKGTELSKLGYSTLSFDLPFHADGNQDRRFATTEKFMKMVDTIIQKYRVPGVPVYLAGHSFGPEVIFEYIKRYPHGVDGAVALSPAAFNPILNEWFMKSTSQATGFWGDTRPNTLGGIWGGQATTDSQWNNSKSLLPDPTEANPKLKLVAMSGDLEEYAPGPVLPNGEPAKESRTYDICIALKAYFKHMICTREPGVGHYIFSHRDEFGNDIVLREFLRVTQNTEAEMLALPAKMSQIVKDLKIETDARVLAPTDKLAQRYLREPMFKAWMDQDQGGIEKIKTLISENDQTNANTIQKQYTAILQARELSLFKNIEKLKEYDPKFYSDNQQAFEKVFTEKGIIVGAGDALVTKYLDRLSLMDPLEREKLFTSSPEVYNAALDLQHAQQPKVIVEKQNNQVETSQRTLSLQNGETLEIDLTLRPTETQVPLVVEALVFMRTQKLFREAQPIADWLNTWLNMTFSKDRTLSTWSYK